MSATNQGFIHVYTGPGKGKTTAALGLAWRMLGRGGRVYICQFLKPAGLKTCEAQFAHNIIQHFPEQLTFDRLENPWDMRKIDCDPAQRQEMQTAIDQKLTHIRSRFSTPPADDLVILDEIVFCLAHQLANLKDLVNLLDSRPTHTEIVLTGRDAPQVLIDKADLVTEMAEIKHPYTGGMPARAGIEY